MLNKPLKMSDGTRMESIEELRENADAVSLLGNVFRGTLTDWCKEHHYDKESEELFELNNKLVRWICDILNIEYTDDMPIDDPKELTVFEKNNTFGHVTNTLEKNFSSYIEEQSGLQYYEVEIDTPNNEENTSDNAEVTIYNILTEVKLNCMVPFHRGEEGEKELFDKIIHIINKVEKINWCCSMRFSGSGGYGYGLELI